MTYVIKTVEPKAYWNELVEFCKRAETEGDNPARNNIRYTGWETNPSSLLWAVQRDRFSVAEGTGTFQVVECEGTPICLAGAYRAKFDAGTAIVGCRAWTMPEHRARFVLGDLILPIQLQWTVESGHDIAMCTFNTYNAWLAKMILRAASGRALRLGRTSSPVYQDWLAYPRLLDIQNTHQIALYKQLGVQDRTPDWSEADTGIPIDLS